ncbi:MAG: hypothetical protein KatS3mg013_1360 [Actinomycetota bacterium]|nr:MAG: hypothetical protein KatS3mg013_1360 [Actinomycetota bacterium]
MAVRIGIGLFTGQVPAWSKRDVAQEYRDTIELVRLAEQLGFESAWVSEHHGTSDAYLPSLLPFLAALAQATTRIELGTGVVLTPLHDPIRLAEDAAVVDQLSGGRLLLGLGLGWREEEFRMFRIPAHERLARHVEAIEILRRAWTGRRFTFEGTVFRFDRVRVTPAPARPGGPPILLGGYAPPALRRAGRIADGYLTDAGDPEELRQTIALLDEGARTAGRDPATLRLVLLRDVVVTDEGGRLVARARGSPAPVGGLRGVGRRSRHPPARQPRAARARRAGDTPVDRVGTAVAGGRAPARRPRPLARPPGRARRAARLPRGRCGRREGVPATVRRGRAAPAARLTAATPTSALSPRPDAPGRRPARRPHPG